MVAAVGTSLAPDQLRAARWHALLLDDPDPGPGAVGDAAAAVAGIARHLGGLQAQAAPPARLAVRPRAARLTGLGPASTALTAADVDRACADGVVTRTWAMRGTLHLVATPDVRWMTSLFGPFLIQKDRRRRLQLGLDDQLCERALSALGSMLAGSPPLTRAELIERLAAAGVEIDPLLMGYRDRDLVLDPARKPRIQAGGGFVQPTVLAGGRVAGTWRLDRRAARARLTVTPFGPLTAATRKGLAAEATDVGRFLGTDVTFEVAAPS
jgi:hypothetical protein